MDQSTALDALVSHFQAARDASLRGKHADALERDLELVAIARRIGSAEMELIGLRFIGLCHYRLDQLEPSRTNLEAALGLAVRLDWTSQRLLVANHLCSTLRRQGAYAEAVEHFKTALANAKLPLFLHERCRLLMNYGALLDELGQRARADDCYSRAEELAEFLGNPDRLANARGLAARSAVLRHEVDIALEKYRDEARLAREAKSLLRALSAAIHEARLINPPRERIRRLSEILEDKELEASTPRTIDARLALADAYLADGDVLGAWTQLEESRALCSKPEKGDPHWYKRTVIHEELATLSQRVGLHGAALHYLQLTVDERHQKLEPLRANAMVREMAQSRLTSLRELADGLVDEALSVTREEKKKNAVAALVRRVRGSNTPRKWDDLVEEWSRRRDSAPREVGRLRTRIDGQSEQRWRELLGDAYAKLQEDTRANLRSADLAYSAETDDLAWSAHRLALAVEHELRHRLHPPKYRKRLGLGEYLVEIADLFRYADPVSNSRHAPLCQHLLPSKDKLRPLLILRQKIFDLEGRQLELPDLRNAVAHGSERKEFPHLSRLTVDAIKRRLVLEPTEGGGPPVLRYLATLTLP